MTLVVPIRTRVIQACLFALGIIFSVVVLLAPIAGYAFDAQTVITRATTNQSGEEADQGGGLLLSPFSVSADGRYALFLSSSTNLVPGVANGKYLLFRKDMQTGEVRLVSADAAGVPGNEAVEQASISGDGRYVSFSSAATNLVPNDTNGIIDVFVKDMQTGAITRATTDANGNEAAAAYTAGLYSDISANGRYVVFASWSDNLVPNDTNNTFDVFVKDMQTGAITRASTDTNGNEVAMQAIVPFPSISDDGRYVAFNTTVSTLVPNDTNNDGDVFVKDMQTGAITRASTSAVGGEADLRSFSVSISGNGRYVAFYSRATNLVPNDTNGVTDVFVKDLQTGAIERVNTDESGNEADALSTGFEEASISADGRYVLFDSFATNLVPNDTNGVRDLFVKDMQTGKIARVSTDANGNQLSTQTFEYVGSMSGDGAYIAYTSINGSVVVGDTNNTIDLFVRGNPFKLIPNTYVQPQTLPVQPGGKTTIVLAGLTKNGAPLGDLTDYVLTIVNDGGLTGLVLGADGTLTIPSSAPPGTYAVMYQLCEIVDPSDCATAQAVLGISTDGNGSGGTGGGGANNPGGSDGELAPTGRALIEVAAALTIIGLSVIAIRFKRAKHYSIR